MSGGTTPYNGARLVLATHNKGKLRELRELLRGQVPGLDVDTQVVDAAAAGAPDVAETGVTFAENSLLKARAVAEATGLIAIADDSGLAVDVLGGAPGIFSARWSGKHGDDVANRCNCHRRSRDRRHSGGRPGPGPCDRDGVRRDLVPPGLVPGAHVRGR